MRASSEVKVTRPSHLADLGKVLQALHSGEEEHYRKMYTHLPSALDKLLADRGIRPAERQVMVDKLSATLLAAVEASLDLVQAGKTFESIAEAIEYNLRTRARDSVTTPGGFTINL